MRCAGMNFDIARGIAMNRLLTMTPLGSCVARAARHRRAAEGSCAVICSPAIYTSILVNAAASRAALSKNFDHTALRKAPVMKVSLPMVLLELMRVEIM